MTSCANALCLLAIFVLVAMATYYMVCEDAHFPPLYAMAQHSSVQMGPQRPVEPRTVESNLNTPLPFESSHASTTDAMGHVDSAFVAPQHTEKTTGFVKSWSADSGEQDEHEREMVSSCFNTFDESVSARSSSISAQAVPSMEKAKAGANTGLYSDMAKADFRGSGGSKARTVGLNPNMYCRKQIERPLNACSVSFLDSAERQDAVDSMTNCYGESSSGVEACGFATCRTASA